MTALTGFVDKVTPIVSTWLNQVDVFVNTLFASATTAAQARTALGSGATGDALFATATAAAARTVLGLVSEAQPINFALAVSVSGGALTVALKSAAGTDCTASDTTLIPFRNSTLATGTPVVRSVTAALSVAPAAGDSLGASNSGAVQ
jgi:hypothetical protein